MMVFCLRHHCPPPPPSVLIKYQATNLEPTLQRPPLLNLHTPSHHPPVLTSLGPDTGQPGTNPLPPDTAEITQLASLKPAYLNLPSHLTETTIKALVHGTPLPQPPDWFCCFPNVVLDGVTYFLLLRTVSNSLFNGNHILLCWLYRTSDSLLITLCLEIYASKLFLVFTFVLFWV